MSGSRANRRFALSFEVRIPLVPRVVAKPNSQVAINHSTWMHRLQRRIQELALPPASVLDHVIGSLRLRIVAGYRRRDAAGRGGGLTGLLRMRRHGRIEGLEDRTPELG